MLFNCECDWHDNISAIEHCTSWRPWFIFIFCNGEHNFIFQTLFWDIYDETVCLLECLLCASSFSYIILLRSSSFFAHFRLLCSLRAIFLALTNKLQLAKVEKLKPMEIELKKLEDLTESTVLEFSRMVQREFAHKDTNESTNERLLHLSIFSGVCTIVLAFLQAVYLKRYFQQKKLI